MRALCAAVLIVGCGGGDDSHVLPGDAPMADVMADATVDAMPKGFGYTYAKPTEPDLDLGLGRSVAVSADGSTIAVAAWRSPGGELNDGAAYIFRRAGTTWAQQAYVTAAHPGAYDQFGYSVALSADGNTLAVGAINEDSAATGINGNDQDDSATDSGAVYVFQFDGSAWTQQAYVKAASTAGYNMNVQDNFGLSVALSGDGNTLAVSCPGDDSNASGINGNAGDNSVGDSGATYVFVRSGATWTQQAYIKALHPDQSDEFGVQVSLAADGNTLVVGSFNEASSAAGVDGDQTNNTMFGAGAAYVFTRTGSTWAQSAYLKASDPYNGKHFSYGLAVSADASTIAAGSTDEMSSGAVYVFAKNGASWQQQSLLQGVHPAPASDQFGRSLALSATGNDVVVYSRHGYGRGIDPVDTTMIYGASGAVDWFRRSGTWAPLHYLKSNFPDTEDDFGAGLSMSADGKTVGIGAWGDDSSATGIDGDQQTNLGHDRGALFILE